MGVGGVVQRMPMANVFNQLVATLQQIHWHQHLPTTHTSSLGSRGVAEAPMQTNRRQEVRDPFSARADRDPFPDLAGVFAREQRRGASSEREAGGLPLDIELIANLRGAEFEEVRGLGSTGGCLATDGVCVRGEGWSVQEEASGAGQGGEEEVSDAISEAEDDVVGDAPWGSAPVAHMATPQRAEDGGRRRVPHWTPSPVPTVRGSAAHVAASPFALAMSAVKTAAAASASSAAPSLLPAEAESHTPDRVRRPPLHPPSSAASARLRTSALFDGVSPIPAARASSDASLARALPESKDEGGDGDEDGGEDGDGGGDEEEDGCGECMADLHERLQAEHLRQATGVVEVRRRTRSTGGEERVRAGERVDGYQATVANGTAPTTHLPPQSPAPRETASRLSDASVTWTRTPDTHSRSSLRPITSVLDASVSMLSAPDTADLAPRPALSPPPRQRSSSAVWAAAYAATDPTFQASPVLGLAPPTLDLDAPRTRFFHTVRALDRSPVPLSSPLPPSSFSSPSVTTFGGAVSMPEWALRVQDALRSPPSHGANSAAFERSRAMLQAREFGVGSVKTRLRFADDLAGPSIFSGRDLPPLAAPPLSVPPPPYPSTLSTPRKGAKRPPHAPLTLTPASTVLRSPLSLSRSGVSVVPLQAHAAPWF
jgi:hypothetical protein